MDFSPDEGQQAVADVVTSALGRDNSWDALVDGGEQGTIPGSLATSLSGDRSLRVLVRARTLAFCSRAVNRRNHIAPGQRDPNRVSS